MTQERERGFILCKADREGNSVTVARFTCRCGATHDQVVRPSQGMNPEEIAKRARRDGWDAHAFRLSGIRCPACQAARRQRRSPVRAEPPTPPTPNPAGEIIASAIRARIAPLDLPFTPPAPEPVHPMNPPTPAFRSAAAPLKLTAKPAPPKAEPTLPREATTAERVKVRALLDANFDDAAGRYLDGYSDQRIGEEVGVPWAIVARIREVGYGPIKVDPEIDAIRSEMAKLRTENDLWAKSTAAKLRDLEDRIAAVEKARAA